MDINFDADEHPVHSNEISHSGVVNFRKDWNKVDFIFIIYYMLRITFNY
jgi:hypothetical protein